MSPRHAVYLVAVAAVALVACSDQPPAAPSTPSGVPSTATPEDTAAVSTQALPGSYDLFLATTAGQIVSTLPTTGLSSELLLWAQVRDSAGILAQGGIVIFQVCMRRSQTPPWRPSAECDSGAATWSHVSTRRMEPFSCGHAPAIGNACITFGSMSNPITIGFRYLYRGQGTIANGVSLSKNMTWVAVP
jgi:hypothetical protein